MNKNFQILLKKLTDFVESIYVFCMNNRNDTQKAKKAQNINNASAWWHDCRCTKLYMMAWLYDGTYWCHGENERVMAGLHDSVVMGMEMNWHWWAAAVVQAPVVVGVEERQVAVMQQDFNPK